MRTRSRGMAITMLIVGVISLVLGIGELFTRDVPGVTTFWTIALGVLLVVQGGLTLNGERHRT